jgi:hypothetical protein
LASGLEFTLSIQTEKEEYENERRRRQKKMRDKEYQRAKYTFTADVNPFLFYLSCSNDATMRLIFQASLV